MQAKYPRLHSETQNQYVGRLSSFDYCFRAKQLFISQSWKYFSVLLGGRKNQAEIVEEAEKVWE